MTNLRDNVKAFHVAMEMFDPVRPCVPTDDVVRLRARLITEEYFETMRALFGTDEDFGAAEMSMRDFVNTAPVEPDLTEFADGLADLMYVAEGSFLAFGIDSAPIHAEVPRSNMAKVGGPIREDGKRLKPAGWTPPDIAGVIAAQSA
jgi:predicted HAD superfamily Cof-like phosphohydrolase